MQKGNSAVSQVIRPAMDFIGDGRQNDFQETILSRACQVSDAADEYTCMLAIPLTFPPEASMFDVWRRSPDDYL
jgi:hypothetical protein